MTIKYRTKDAREDYEFSFEQQRNGSWRAYIVSQPPYGSRSTDPNKVHRLTDARDGRKYVCWNREIWSRDDLEWVVSNWCDKTQDYIKYGIPIK